MSSPFDDDQTASTPTRPAPPGYYPGDALQLPAANCRWCGCSLEELPSGPWVDDYGSTSCTVPVPGKHWPRVD